jgi:hypothetical protein
LGKSEIKKKANRNERKEKIFDLDAEEEDHKSIDSDNFSDLKNPSYQEYMQPRVNEFIHYEAY